MASLRASLTERALDVRDAAYLAGGLAYYLVRNTTPERAYQAMVRLFCRTGGRSNDLLSRAISALSPPVRFERPDGVLGPLDASRRAAIQAALDRDGYYVFDDRLADDTCARLLELASTVPSVAQGAGPGGAGDALLVYDREAPRAVRYELRPAELLADPTVQALIADVSILAVGQDYLRAAPVLDIVAMWWHTAFRDTPDARAAQLYHFDMDRPRWLKFFFYVTDVGPDNGPHCFIRGSHRTGAIAEAMLARGYARLDDAVVAQHHPAADHIRFTGRKGTIIAEDTRGLHKGQHVMRGDRLVFQLELTNTLFGTGVPDMRLPPDMVPALRERTRSHASIYSAFEVPP